MTLLLGRVTIAIGVLLASVGILTVNTVTVRASSPLPLPVPSWWLGMCDTARWSGTNITPSAVNNWNGLIACYPGDTPKGYLSISETGPLSGNVEWQCVELSERYLYQRFGIPALGPWYVDGVTYGVTNGYQVVDHYWSYLSSHPGAAPLTLVRPGPGHVPQPGDVVSYTGGISVYPNVYLGHTDVVTATNVDPNTGSGSYTTIDQNWNSSGTVTWLVGAAAGLAPWTVQMQSNLTILDWLHFENWRPDIPVVGDFRNLGTDGIGGVRASDTQLEWLLRSTPSPGVPDIQPFYYGGRDDTPIVGHWIKGASLGIGVVRREGPYLHWYLRDTVSGGLPDHDFYYGNANDTPVVGDWFGTGQTGIGVTRPNKDNGQLEWILANSYRDRVPTFDFFYGGIYDTPVVGSWLGNRFSIGIVRRDTNGELLWALRYLPSAGIPDTQFYYGWNSSIPVTGNFSGSGVSTNGVYSPALGVPGSQAQWLLRLSLGLGRPDLNFFYGAGAFIGG